MRWPRGQCSWTTTLGHIEPELYNIDCLQQEAVQTIAWPAMSPDMNPTEYVWDFIGRQINQRNPKCQNIDELRTAILQEWQQFPQERLRRRVRSMMRRLQNFTINAVDILAIDFYALHIRTIDAFKSS